MLPVWLLALPMALTSGISAQELSQANVYLDQVSDRGSYDTYLTQAIDDASTGVGAFNTESIDGTSCEPDGTSGVSCASASSAPSPESVRETANVVMLAQYGAGHSVEVFQRGVGHVLEAVMRGTGHGLTVRQLEGNQNDIRSLELEGASHSLKLIQVGSRLTYTDRFDFVGSGSDGSVRQQGTGLSLIQEGTWPTGFQIEQTGNGPGPGSAIRVSHQQGSIVTTPISR